MGCGQAQKAQEQKSDQKSDGQRGVSYLTLPPKRPVGTGTYSSEL